MFDACDPRDPDARDGDYGVRDSEEDWLVLGRGPGSGALRDDTVERDTRGRDENARHDRDRDTRDRDDERGGLDPRDVFMRDLDLPDGRERELVHERERDYTLSGSDTRALSTGPFAWSLPRGERGLQTASEGLGRSPSLRFPE